MSEKTIPTPTQPLMQAVHYPVEMSLDQCIKCNICTTACPVAAVTDLFPGPKFEAPQAGRFRQPDQPTPDHSVDYCSGCRVCNMVCPTGVKIAEMNARSRAEIVSQGRVSPRLRLRNNLIARTELIGKLGQPLAPVANFVLGNGLVRRATAMESGHSPPCPCCRNFPANVLHPGFLANHNQKKIGLRWYIFTVVPRNTTSLGLVNPPFRY